MLTSTTSTTSTDLRHGGEYRGAPDADDGPFDAEAPAGLMGEGVADGQVSLEGEGRDCEDAGGSRGFGEEGADLAGRGETVYHRRCTVCYISFNLITSLNEDVEKTCIRLSWQEIFLFD